MASTKMNSAELKSFLDDKVIQYNTRDFIDSDPVQIPHLFSQKEDIEIAGLLAATIAWGNRKMIIKNAHRMMELMGNSPYDFILSHQEKDLKDLESFVHRTFNGQDFIVFIKGLQHIYQKHNGLEAVFAKNQESLSMQKSIHEFKKVFFDVPHATRTQKHISDPLIIRRLNVLICICVGWFAKTPKELISAFGKAFHPQRSLAHLMSIQAM